MIDAHLKRIEAFPISTSTSSATIKRLRITFAILKALAHVIDTHLKRIEAFPMNTSTSSATIKRLRITFATHGLPVVTDNGSNFVSREFEDFLKQNAIRHIGTAPFHPASNGMAERAVQTFKEAMKKMNKGSVETRVSPFIARYRITPQTSTSVSPAELL